jgi:hypothetical protein
MNQLIKQLYIGGFFVSCFLFLLKNNSFKRQTNVLLKYKYILVLFSALLITISIYKKYKIIDDYIIGIILFINVLFLLLIDMNDTNPNYLHIVSMLGIIYLLISFKQDDFKVNRGEIIKPNKQWILLYIILLLLWYLSMSKQLSFQRSIFITSLLVLYPLMFPMEEFLIHRVYPLIIVFAINLYFFDSPR